MARIFKRCPCPEELWETCPHRWVVRYRTTGGRSSRQREQSFGADLREAEDFALKVEHDKRAHVFVDPKAGRKSWRAFSLITDSGGYHAARFVVGLHRDALDAAPQIMKRLQRQ